MLYSKAFVRRILPMLTSFTPSLEQLVINVVAFSTSITFSKLYVSILPDDKIFPPVKESGSVLFPYANI